MLRNRSRAVTSKQALMGDHTAPQNLSSPTKNPSNTPISSFLGSPRFFNGFLSKRPSDAAAAEITIMTPTSILDTKNSSSFVNPFAYETTTNNNSNSPKLSEINSPHKAEPQAQQAIGLALIDSLDEDKNDGHFTKAVNRMNLFGSKLKVQIPTVSQISPEESPKSGDFGIKTRNSQLFSPFPSTPAAKEFARQLSLKEMELSEDYTRVITHGPNPKTTHIFDDCIVASSSEDEEAKFGDDDYDDKKMDCEPIGPTSPSMNFLSFCHNCRDNLEQDKDIYIYRGEKAFCSQECRGQEMLFEMKNPEADDTF